MNCPELSIHIWEKKKTEGKVAFWKQECEISHLRLAEKYYSKIKDSSWTLNILYGHILPRLSNYGAQEGSARVPLRLSHTLKHCMHLLYQGQTSLGFIQVNSKQQTSLFAIWDLRFG